MGFLSDRKGDDMWWGLPIVFWIVATPAVFVGAAAALGWTAEGSGWLTVVILVGGVAGAAIGFYASMGRSWLANILALPGLLLAPLMPW